MRPDYNLISESSNAYIYYSPKDSLIIIEFKEIDLIDEEQYKENAKKLLQFVEDNKIKRMMFNTLKLKAVFSPELQRWIGENINKKLLKLLDKVAVVQAKDLIVNISLQQYIEEANKYGITAQEAEFEDPEKALEWLLS